MGDKDGSNKYVIRVFTGSKLTAGTDADVLVTLYGPNGDSGERKLDNAGNNFERNAEDKFNITAKDLGALSKIKIGHDNSGGGAAWYLDKVIVDDVEDGATYEFPCDRWLADDEDDNKIVRELACTKATPATKEKEKKPPEEEKKEGNSNNNSAKEVGEGDNKYVVHIYTGSKFTAGTDANVLITLYGEDGESREICLDNIDNNFEKDKEDVFVVKANKLGKLSKVKIGHDNSGAGPAWFLDKVVVGDGSDNTMYEFACDRWLADDEDDNLIVRELKCTKTTQNQHPKKKKDPKEKGKGKDKSKEKKDSKEGETKEGETNEDEEGAASSECSDTPQDPEHKRQFEAEFDRLQKSLEKESTRIIKPDFKPYSPFIFSSLEPYYNTYTVQYILDYPDHVKHGFITRKTAVGIVDPEVSHEMDVALDDVPPSTPRSPRVENPVPKMIQDTESKKEGSTRLPKWPIVEFVKTGDMAKDKLNWGDVPKLREELRTKYSSNAQNRKKKDYTRTQQDWTRMELGKLKDINEVNRTHMQVTCNTYLGTSSGSKAAVKSLAKVLE